MKYNELTVGRQRKTTRVGRGISAGKGKTAGRGTKGQGARKSPVRAGFEGGQTPIHMRLPKLRGFKSKRPVTENIYTGQLEELKKPAIDNRVLFESGLVTSPYSAVKLIKKGELKSKKIVRLQGASTGAVGALTKVGGSFEKIDRQPRPAKKTEKE